MGKYGLAADKAVRLLKQNVVNDPIKAWELAVNDVFPDSESSRQKSCPKNTFLGLCEEGYIDKVDKGNYTRSQINKDYAIQAVLLLSENPMLTEKELWNAVIDEPEKKYNSQMDVVKTLWNNKFITLKD